MEILLVLSMILFFFIVGLVCIFIYFEAASHFSDLAKLRKWDKVYKIYEKQLSELTKKLDSLKINESKAALLNCDTPYSSLINAYTEVQNKSASEQAVIAEAEVRIEERNCGFYKFIVNIYGEK